MLGMWLGFRGLAALMALAAALLILLSTGPHGIALTPDSVGYISVARSLTAGNGFTTHHASPLIVQPPLYPIILTLPDLLLNVDPLDGSRYVNAAFLGFIVFLSGLLFERYLTSRTLIMIGLTAVLLSPVLFFVSIFAMSELTFVFFTVLFLLALDSYLAEKSLARLLLLALIAGLACVTRYIGVTLILTGAATMFFLQGNKVRQRLFHLVLFGLIAAAPLGAWIVRNYILSETLTGVRTSSPFSPAQSVFYAAATYLDLFLPLVLVYERLQSPILAIVLVAIAGLLFVFIFTPGRNWRRSITAIAQTGPVMIFVVIYMAFLIATSALININRIGYREMSVVFVPTTLIIFSVIESQSTWTQFLTVKWLGRLRHVPRAGLVVLLLVAWLTIQAGKVGLRIYPLVQTGIDYSHVR